MNDFDIFTTIKIYRRRLLVDRERVDERLALRLALACLVVAAPRRTTATKRKLRPSRCVVGLYTRCAPR
jgi:hypothetical protein